MKRLMTFSVLLATAWAWAAAADNGLSPCLDYFQVGDSGCTSVKKPAQDPTPTAPAAMFASATMPPVAKSPLDSRIDEFLEGHGKPPREFVAFYLEPTPENAMKWISKYNELIDRNIQISVAWTQAETLYAQALQNGVSPSALVSSTYAPVPDFGIPIPGFTDNPSIMGNSIPGFTYTPLGGTGLPAATVPSLPPQITPPPATQPEKADDTRIGTPVLITERMPETPEDTATPVPATPPLGLTYYFSATCPYCLRFEPELVKALKNHPLVSMDCVDLTPLTDDTMPRPQNIQEKIPQCRWRLPTDNELSERGIRQTPTLLVRHGEGVPHKISGYMDADRLEAYFGSAGPL